ncbi:hypothetical protein V6C21_06625 [[Clostridium] cellulosi]
MKKKYAIKDKNGNYIKMGMYTEPEVRMAAKAGLRVFEAEGPQTEITQQLTGLFGNSSKE